MKKLAALFVSALLIVFVHLFVGCKCQADCEKDRLLTEGQKEFFPYSPGDIASYVSDQNDTLTFTCSSRELIYENHPDDFPECCGTYSIERLQLFLETTDKDTLKIETDPFPNSAIRCSISANNFKITGGWYFSNPNIEKLDSILIAGKTFYNVYPNYDKNMYLGLTDGMVGFTIAGNEWRLLLE